MENLLLLASLCMPGLPVTTIGTVVDIVTHANRTHDVYVAFGASDMWRFERAGELTLRRGDDVLIIVTPCDGPEMLLPTMYMHRPI